MKRTPYMSLLLEATYTQMMLNAVFSGTIAGAWEKAIAERLQEDYKDGSPLPIATLDYLGIPNPPRTIETWIKAAYLIRATEPETENA
jgi:hypothetical protein